MHSFTNSFCDTPYSSWKPEKGKYGYEDIHDFYMKHKHIKHTMITGGGPTIHSNLLKELCKIGKFYNHYITIETEGSEFVATYADLISLSSKLPNSTPVPGTWMPYLNREVTESDKKQHEKWRQNYQAMKALITYHPDYQFKPVISDEKDLEEIKYLQEILGIPNDKVYLMPEGMNKEQVESRRKWLSELCQKEGYNFTDRLHILIYGDQRGV